MAPIWKIKLHFSRKLRASKNMHPGGNEERDPIFHRVIIPTKILDKEGSQNIAREICPHNVGEKADKTFQWRKGKGKQGAMSCPVAVVQLRFRIRLAEKRSAQVHWCREIEAWVFLLAGLMIVRQGIFLIKQRGLTQINVLSDRF